MDMAKIIVAIFVAKLAFALIAGIAIMTGVTLPISAGIFIIVTIGFVITLALDSLDKKFHISEEVKIHIDKGLKERVLIEEWNIRNHPFSTSPKSIW